MNKINIIYFNNFCLNNNNYVGCLKCKSIFEKDMSCRCDPINVDYHFECSSLN